MKSDMPTRNRYPISAMMIVKNELPALKKSLPALQFCDEIVIIDSGSEDGSIEYARSIGAKVIHQDFLGYGPQKSFGVSQCSHDWVINVDADEVVTPELLKELNELTQRDSDLSGIYINSRLHFLGTLFHFGREAQVKVLRVFKKSVGNFDQSKIHEKVILTSGYTTRAKYHLVHYSYPTIEHYLSKMNRYTTLQAERLCRESPNTNARLKALLFPLKFFHFYIVHLNFLNGFPGFIWSALSTTAYLVKFLKLSILLSQVRLKNET